MSEYDLPHSEVRVLSWWRWLLRPICWMRGHRRAWIRPIAYGGYIGGCSRCSTVLRSAPQPGVGDLFYEGDHDVRVHRPS